METTLIRSFLSRPLSSSQLLDAGVIFTTSHSLISFMSCLLYLPKIDRPVDRVTTTMSTSANDDYNGPLSPCTAFMDSELSPMRGFQSAHLFWSAAATDAMALRDQKFKAYNYRAPIDPAPKFEPHYEDHFTVSSRQPRMPSVAVVEQPLQPKPQQHTFEVEFLKWVIIFVALLFAMWCLGLMASMFGSVVTLVVTGMISFCIVAWLTEWLKTEEEFEL
ncbi:hypothetical protein BKA64DRAFT_660546 [Cadophora sp. MPI-SDFR-AT-0126]|nr:hypothetical protein BKA64DRAFT_660546 [Leotiomycetes sp. MPI-SDFR-AT-0126]